MSDRAGPGAIGLAAIGLVLAALLSGCLGSDDDNAGATFDVQTEKPFASAPVLASHDGELKATLTVSEGEVAVAGTTVLAKSYNGHFPGPTMRVSPGDWIRLRFRNRLDEATNIHFHGFHTSPSGIADNVLRSIPAQTTAKVAVPVPADMAPGTYWYHSHEHGSSEEQVFSGLSGVIVVDGLEDRLPPDLRDVTQRIFALKDLQVHDGAIVTQDINSDAPTTRTVNGLVDPVVQIQPGETQLWRLANISADIWYRVNFSGMPFHVIAEDSNPVGKVWSSKTLLMPPGKRFDVLVRGPKSGEYLLKTLAYSTGKAGDSYPERALARIQSAGDPVDPVALPTSLGAMPDLADAHVDTRRHFVFSESADGNSFFINGKQFDHHVVNVHTELGQTEEWVIRNVSDEQHPFHIHINDFQVISINGRPHRAYSLQDTQVLPVHGKVVIRMRFTDFTGKFVYHCHILAHEDHGMMGLIQVSDPTKDGVQGDQNSAAKSGGHGGHGGHGGGSMAAMTVN